MSRIEFDGPGTPIPAIALPPFGSDSDLPPTVLTFTDNAELSIDLYRDLGFTHFEACCVGAAGGRGGDSSEEPFYVYEEIYRPVSSDVWAIWLSQFDNTTIFTGWDPGDPSRPGTQQDIQNFNNPSHMLKFRTYRQILLYPTLSGMGGAGGGGGMHRVSGLLVDLPDSVPIVVGKVGADAGIGQVRQSGLWTPSDNDHATGHDYPNAFITDYLNDYPPPQSSYLPPQAGADGGASSFADAVCQASGGKGGSPGRTWNGFIFLVDGDGGDGGLGNRALAGGGGAGSTAEGVNGSDGTWNSVTGVGAGGGGGKGGRAYELIGDPRFGAPTRIDHLATAGGQGSYSFADTSVYGPRQYRQAWTYLKPTVGVWSAAIPGPYGTHPENLPNGVVTYTPTSDPYLAIPGGGGGARPLKNLKAGSKATGFSPDGVVVIRLTRIV